MADMQVVIASRPRPGCTVCGDGADFWVEEKQTLCCVADGLGHGAEAGRIASLAIRCVAEHREQTLAEVLTATDRVLYDTRGAAVGVAMIDMEARLLLFAGIGNTRAVLIHAGRENIQLESAPGIAGDYGKSIMPRTVSYTFGDIVLICTDGIGKEIDFAADLTLNKPQLLADSILAEYACPTDDALVLVANERGPFDGS